MEETDRPTALQIKRAGLRLRMQCQPATPLKTDTGLFRHCCFIAAKLEC